MDDSSKQIEQLCNKFEDDLAKLQKWISSHPELPQSISINYPVEQLLKSAFTLISDVPICRETFTPAVPESV
jgi:hypothetical protein